MPVFRGLGGAGSSDDDATISAVTAQAQIATTKANEASASANSAASSSATAVTKADEASTSATNAANSASAASSSASTASTAATAAGNAQTAAETAQTAAELAETNAETAETNAETAETNAAASASAASTSETNAANSASTASTAATNASNSATAAQTAQTNAETAQTAAEAAQAAAEAAQEAIDGFFLGVKTANPTLDNNGNAVTAGDWYFNSVDNSTRIYDGSNWNTINPDLVGDLTPQLGGNLDLNGNDITGTGNVNITGDITFGDNNKAIFGAGSDLQIYHDGSNSYVSDIGTGNLIIQGAHFVIQTPNAEKILQGLNNGAVSLYYDGVQKLATTSTGIDVTGTVTADGLTVEQATSPTITISSTKNGTWTAGEVLGNILFDGDDVSSEGAATKVSLVAESQNTFGAAFDLAIKTSDGANGINTALKILHNNDLELYEDTGTTPKFFWDASTERLGIGNVAPTTALDVTGTISATDLVLNQGSSSSVFLQDSTATNGYQIRANVSSGADFGLLVEDLAGKNLVLIASNGDISFYEDTGTTAKLTWDASAEELQFKDNVKAEFGDGGDLELYSDGTNGIIKSSATQEYRAVSHSFESTTGGTTRAVIGPDFRVASDTNTHALFVEGSSGNVGIGTDSPASIVGGTDTNPVLSIGGTDSILTTGDKAGSISFITTDSSYTNTYADGVTAEIASVAESGVGAAYGLAMYTGTITGSNRSERLRITSSGNVGLGTTAPATTLDVTGTVTADGLVVDAGTNALQTNITGAGNGFTLQNYSGDSTTLNSDMYKIALLYGNSSYNGALHFARGTGAADGHFYISTNNQTKRLEVDNVGDISFYDDSGTSQDFYWDASTSRLGLGTTAPATTLDVNGDVTITDKIIHSGDTNTAIRFPAADTVTVETAGAERMRIDASGNLLVGGTGTPTSSVGNFVLYNGTAPTGNATNGVILYAEDVSASSELKVRDEAGNVTTLSPHNFDLIPEGPSEDMAWSYYSERDGKRINVDMLKAIRLLEQLTGEKLVHTS